MIQKIDIFDITVEGWRVRLKSAILINFIKYIFLLFLFFFLSLSIEKVVESIEFVRIRRWTTSRVIASMFARRRNESPINSYYCMSYFELPLLRFAMCGNRINPRRQTNNLPPLPDYRNISIETNHSSSFAETRWSNPSPLSYKFFQQNFVDKSWGIEYSWWNMYTNRDSQRLVR